MRYGYGLVKDKHRSLYRTTRVKAMCTEMGMPSQFDVTIMLLYVVTTVCKAERIQPKRSPNTPTDPKPKLRTSQD